MLSYDRKSCPETARAVENFGTGQTPRSLIKAYGEVKLAALRAQQETEHLYSTGEMEALEESLSGIILGRHDHLFPLNLKQGGAGTSLHMNICEVTTLLAEKKCGTRLSPLDDLARFQSTNDTLPTAVTIMMYRFLDETEQQVVRLQEELIRYEQEYSGLIMTGRTETMDALPITLGQVYGAWAGSIERDRWRLNKLKERLREIPLGGTAMGTCFSAPARYVFRAEQHLRQITGLPLCRSQNLTDAVAHQDKWAECASGWDLLAGNMEKIAGDIMAYASSGIGELRHPQAQYGSTIMPEKVNPVFCELVIGLSVQVQGQAGLIRDFSRRGRWQLNAYTPFLTEAFLELEKCLTLALKTLNERLLPEIQPDREAMEKHLLSSSALINSLRPRLGYERLKDLGSRLTGDDRKDRDSLCRALSRETGVPEESFRDWFDPDNLTSYYKEQPPLPPASPPFKKGSHEGEKEQP